MKWISADFPNLSSKIKKRICAGTSTRLDGVSKAPFNGLNVATHVGDDLSSVMANRALLREELNFPSEPYWLNQTHTNTVVELPYEYRPYLEADASYTFLTKTLCAVMTADCLPLLLVDNTGTQVAAIHAGWRGLANGIIAKTLAKFTAQAQDLHVYMGPAIGQSAFEVGQDVFDYFQQLNPIFSRCFESKKSQTNILQIYTKLQKFN
ncbi:peptidoglycan editing factor PgeF [Psychrosphaera algicola]|uniref:Purine nucleoside phosphorylase n=1 Tax=Psychrosphaera algicola TaxID=3023714 RepID=A0ABT5F9P6_9GAMM|nr:peptidoglycan editing factor PgeF [Psychrosphaera sp. G1-22]MDC2888254.1 peptidoglycan editing factor PgeF [Psychrosphaera sp. G1-22]